MSFKSKIRKLFPKPVNTPIVLMPQCGEELEGKIALITGGSGGVGLAIAKAFLQAGAKVIIAGTSKDKLDKICTEINDSNLKSIVLNYDEPYSFEGKIKEAENIFGRIDILVSSAGIHVDRDGLDFINTY